MEQHGETWQRSGHGPWRGCCWLWWFSLSLANHSAADLPQAPAAADCRREEKPSFWMQLLKNLFDMQSALRSSQAERIHDRRDPGPQRHRVRRNRAADRLLPARRFAARHRGDRLRRSPVAPGGRARHALPLGHHRRQRRLFDRLQDGAQDLQSRKIAACFRKDHLAGRP